MRLPTLCIPLLLLCASALKLTAQTPATPKLPQLTDPALRLEKLATFPEVEACTTVCGDPSGAFYVGNDPRDSRLSTAQPECSIIRFSSMGADKKRTVFADKIYSPAGSAWHDGWLYVIHDPLMSRFRDTDGDGIADLREDLITNLGLPPYEGLNDHVVSGFTLGMDSFFYISVGDRGIYKARGKDGSELSMRGGGIIRVRPDGTGLEIFSTGTRNHLAVLLDAEDNAFTLDNTDDGNGWWTRLTHHIEGGYYGYPYDYQHAPNYGVTQPSQQTIDAMKRNGHGRQASSLSGQTAVPAVPPGTDRPEARLPGQAGSPSSFLPAMTDFGPGSPTGGLCYLSDGLPEQYRGKLFFSEWGKQNVSVIEVAREGATFRFVKNTPLVQGGAGVDFRPMQLSVAADGSLLIADWQWGGWKGPKTTGTIWRVSWPEAHPAPRLPDESKATVEELLAALGHADRDQRLRAQAELVKRGNVERSAVLNWDEPRLSPQKPVVSALTALAGNENAPTIARCHALWALENVAGRATDALDWSKSTSAALAGISLFYEPLYRLLPITYMDRKSEGSREAVILAQAMRALGISRWKFDREVLDEAAKNLMKTDDPVARREAAQADGNTNYDGLAEKLLILLADPDRTVRFAARCALQKMIERMGLGSWNLDTVAFAKPELSEEEWLLFEGLRLADPHTPELRKITELWENQRDAFDYIAGRLAGKNNAILTDRARAALLLGRWAYQPKPYDGHWWGTQPVKNPPPPNSVAWAGTPAAIAALTAALGDADTAVRLAAAKAFTQFQLTVQPSPRSGAVPAPPDGARGPDSLEALAALRARLSTETDATVRRQLIEALGIQRDPAAMAVFRQIALGDPDMAFRETAIAAVVSIGGDDARQTIAQLAAAQLSPAATRKVIEAAGELRVLAAAPALIAHLAGDNAGNRQAAIKALAQLGPKAGATQPLIAALADPDEKVKQAALEALGALRDKTALPALIEFAKTKKNAKELIAALSAMPDPQSIPVLVNALRDNNSGLRRNALKALKTMRAAALPPIEELLASGKIPREFESEIRAAFDSGAIVKWKMIGPFENVWGAVHPVELIATTRIGMKMKDERGVLRDVSLPIEMSSLFKQGFENAEGHEVGWVDVNADPEAGRVDLEKVFKTNAMVCAYGIAEIESPADADAHLLCGSDDQIAVWLNGVKVHDSGPGSRGYEADKDDVPLHFTAGKNALLVKIGNVGGGWEFAARIPGVEDGRFSPKGAPPDAQQRAHVLAQNADGTWTHRGDPKRGEKIFHDPTGPLGGICAQCHKVRGLGGIVGPDLSLVGSVYQRGDLLTSILEPSKTIGLGFEQLIVETKAGDLIAGAIRKETDDTLTLLGADLQPHLVKKADIKSRKTVETSIMPPGLTLALKPEDAADLLAYLESLRGN